MTRAQMARVDMADGDGKGADGNLQMAIVQLVTQGPDVAPSSSHYRVYRAWFSMRTSHRLLKAMIDVLRMGWTITTNIEMFDTFLKQILTSIN